MTLTNFGGGGLQLLARFDANCSTIPPVDKTQLNRLRESIDEIDGQILTLLSERLKLVLSVGELKRQHGVKVYDPERERRMLDRLAERAQAPLRADVARRVFERIIDESRSQEQHHIAETTGR